VVVEPTQWKPRRDGKRRSRIVEEHRRRKGDPIAGGSTRVPQMTAYRQQTLAVANAIARTRSRPRDLRILAPDAAKILRRNVYGWFERIERGLYGLTSSGHAALLTWADQISRSAERPPEATITLAPIVRNGLALDAAESSAAPFVIEAPPRPRKLGTSRICLRPSALP
jgi:hypothetical protein